MFLAIATQYEKKNFKKGVKILSSTFVSVTYFVYGSTTRINGLLFALEDYFRELNDISLNSLFFLYLFILKRGNYFNLVKDIYYRDACIKTQVS